jgi:hypothetical protein
MITYVASLIIIAMCAFNALNYLDAYEIISQEQWQKSAIDFGSRALEIQMVEVDTEENPIGGESFLAK